MFKSITAKQPKSKSIKRNPVRHVGKKKSPKKSDDLGFMDSLGGIGGGMRGTGEPGDSESSD